MDKVKDFFKTNKYLRDYKYVIFLGVGILTLLITISFIILPSWQKHIFMEKEQTLYEKKLLRLESFASKHRDYEAAYGAKQEQYQKLRAAMPENLKDYDYLDKLQQLSQATGVKLAIEKVSGRTTKKKAQQHINIEVKLSGSYVSFIRFLEEIEKHSNLALDRLSIEGNAQGNIKALGCLKVYASK